MLRFCQLSALVLAVAIVGCEAPPQSTTEMPPPHSVSAQELQKMREQYREEDPNIRIGVVSAVMIENKTAAVDDVSVSDFAPGQQISFVDSNHKTVSHGTIAEIREKFLVINFVVEPGGRAPQIGDYAIRAIK